MENESYEKRYDEQVHSLELKVKELVNKGELAKLQLERMNTWITNVAPSKNLAAIDDWRSD